jgi:hypothetical protein
VPKVYVIDSEVPTYSVNMEKPSGYPTDEIDLTDEELKMIQDAENAMCEAQKLLSSKLLKS